LPGRAPVEEGAVHVGGAAVHRATGVHVLRHRVLQEPLGREDRHLAGALGQDPSHPAEVVAVGMGVDHPVTGRSPRFLRYKAMAAAAVSAEISGSMTITPASPSTM